MPSPKRSVAIIVKKLPLATCDGTALLVPLVRLAVILGGAQAFIVQPTQVVHGNRIACVRALLVPLARLTVVLGDTLAVLIQPSQVIHGEHVAGISAKRALPKWRRDVFAPEGEVFLHDLFGGRSQLLVYHFMFGPDWPQGCQTCSSLADGFDGIRVHLEHHDVALVAISRAPVDQLTAYRQRMGWSFPWVSSYRSSFNFDHDVSFTQQSVAGGAEYNFRAIPAAEIATAPSKSISMRNRL